MPVDMAAVLAACTSRLQGGIDMLKFLGFLKEEKGATAVEYALIIAVVGAIIVASVGLFGDGLEDLFKDIDSTLSDADVTDD